MDPELLNILADPETKQELKLADAALLEKVNRWIAKGSVMNRANQPVSEKIEAGLVAKTNAQFLYPIRDGIPVMLIDESIPLAGLN